MDAVTGPIPEVNLADEPDYQLGALLVSPSACRVSSQGRDERVEPRVMQVLVVLSRRKLQTVTRDQLVEACWSGRAVSDDAVNRVVAQVRALARNFDPAPFVLETVPKVGFRLIPATTDAAPPSLEVLPLPARSFWGRLWDRRLLVFVAAGLVAVVIGVVTWWTGRPAPPTDQSGRVEVMKFELRQGDPELQRFAADLGDSLIRVLTRSSIDTVPQLGSRDAGMGTAQAELRVTGSVDRQGDKIVVNTQVLDRKTGFVLASTQAVRPATELPGFADEIGLETAGPLDCALEDRRQSHRTMDPTVLALYLNTCDALIREGNIQRMLETARRLVKAAPDLAVAHALYGIAQAHAARMLRGSPEAVALQRAARESASRALALDPRTPKAYVAIALACPEWSWFEREQNLRMAWRIDPNLSPGRVTYIRLLSDVGRLKEALQQAERVQASSDPRTWGSGLFPIATISAQLGDMSTAQNTLAQFEQYDADAAPSIRWLIASQWEAPEVALQHLNAIRPKDVDQRGFDCIQQFLSQLPRRIANHARGLPEACESADPTQRLLMLGREGDMDGAYGIFTTSSNVRLSALYGRDMRAFRADPRFMPLAKRLHLLAYWTKSGQWPDFCSEPGLPYDCQRVARSL